MEDCGDIEGVISRESCFKGGVDGPLGKMTLEGSSGWVSDWPGNWCWVNRGSSLV